MTSKRLSPNSFHVGEYIAEEIEARGWTRKDFSRMTGWSLEKVDDVLNGNEQHFTISMAEDCARVFRGTNVVTWLNVHRAWKNVEAKR